MAFNLVLEQSRTGEDSSQENTGTKGRLQNGRRPQSMPPSVESSSSHTRRSVPWVPLMFLLATTCLPPCSRRLTRLVFPTCPGRHEARCKNDLRAICAAMNAYAAVHGGAYPNSLEPLVALDATGRNLLGCEAVPIDSWGREYLYHPAAPDVAHGPTVETRGQDGTPGGRGLNRDISHFIAVQHGDHSLFP